MYPTRYPKSINIFPNTQVPRDMSESCVKSSSRIILESIFQLQNYVSNVEKMHPSTITNETAERLFSVKQLLKDELREHRELKSLYPEYFI